MNDERYLKMYHWLIFCIMACVYGLAKYGFSFKALLAAWSFLCIIVIIVVIMFFIVEHFGGRKK